ncbi:MAG: PD40 domain-containing protein [Verrucomicrobiaceae bacterium]|nr:PD40 domain-containing protein [Verrucomicrobiaceae bacterium]
MRALATVFFVIISSSLSAPSEGFYRSPTLRGDTIVFTSEGDLWRVSVAGGLATRLTTHAAGEHLAAISPNGQTLAFTAAIEGKSELYTMPIDGGVPQRRTFDSAEPRSISWTADETVLFASDKRSTLPDQQLFTLNTASGDITPLPLAQAAAGCVTPDGTLYFVRLPKQNSATKRYRGGWIENLWRFKTGDKAATRLEPNDNSTSRSPMWWNGRIYFLSDRDGTLNIWSIKPDGSSVRQHTKYQGDDVKTPSIDNGRIVYRLGADLWLHDIAKGSDKKLNITLISDFDQRRRQWIKKPFDYVTAWHASPNGERIALTARGEVFVTGFSSGRLVELPRNNSVRYRNANFLDDRNLILQSDASSEIEYYTAPADGSAPPRQLTNDGRIFRFGARPSPDGKWFAWADKNLQLWVRKVEGGESRLLATNASDTAFTEIVWSPDSQWIAFTDEAINTFRQIKLCRVADGFTVPVTSDRTNSFSPAFSPNGEWLYFLSNREMRTLVSSPWGLWQPEPFYTHTTKVFMVALRPGLRHPFRPEDELTPKTVTAPRRTVSTKSEPKADSKAPTTTKTPPPVRDIVPEGISERLEEVPIAAGNYDELTVGDKHLFFLSKPAGIDKKTVLERFEISNKPHKSITYLTEIDSYELKAKANKLIVRIKDKIYTIDAAGPTTPATLKDSAELDGWTIQVEPQEEWRQIYHEAWRMLRDYFYDRGMHGVDWPAVRMKYEPLLARVTERSDLNEILQDVLGELTALHLYVRYGDDRDVPEIIDTASLGATFTRLPEANGWKVDHIWHTDPEYPSKLAPFRRSWVNVKEGDILTHINGVPTVDAPHPNSLLLNQTGKQVLLGIKSADKERKVVLKPISAEADENLRYDEWEYTRRQKVEELGKGQIGYVHLRAMGESDMAQWARDFYPQFRKQALIVDVRHNRGGNIDSWVLEKLLRKAWSWFAPPVGATSPNMQYAFTGHLAAICDQKTASDGEAFSEGFRRLGLGKVIGTRTWGGEIWLSAQRWLVDSGMATAAETGVFSPEGKWLIEGEGVIPDIVVDNEPHQTFLGNDAQLEAAVKHLQALIAKDPRNPPTIPERPKKVFSDDDKKK